MAVTLRSASRMSNRHKTSTAIADDHTLVAEACKNLLEPEFEVVGIVDTDALLLQQVRELKPDVVILDIAMPQLNGLDAIRSSACFPQPSWCT